MIITDVNLLRTPCIDVLPEEISEIKKLLEDELSTSAANGRPGIGLAAPQIGIYKRMAIVRVPGTGGKIFSIDLVNCKIKQGYDKFVFNGEGCLSFPGKEEKTNRFKEIYVIDNMVQPTNFIATGLLAICIQHELDHLNGILLPDLAIKG